MNEKYADYKENTDFNLLLKFNEKLKLSNLRPTPRKSSTDASGYTKDGLVANIELKSRTQILLPNNTLSGRSLNGDTYTSTTMFIESHKACDLLFDWICLKQVPLFINFLEDGSVVVFNLLKLKHRPKKISKKIWSNLYQAFELGKRQELELSDAYIYKYDGNNYILKSKPNDK